MPCAILSSKNSVAKGSLRTSNSLNLYKVLEECSDLLIQFGGHSAAAGVTLQEDKIEFFENRFEEIISNHDFITGETIEIDSLIELSEINISFLSDIEKMEPFEGKSISYFSSKNAMVDSKKSS